MQTIDFCRSEQLRCAGEYVASGDRGALLGMHDNFAEEFLMDQERNTPAVGSTHYIYTHPTRKIEPWGEAVEVVATSVETVIFKGKAGRKSGPLESMTHAHWAEATAR